MQRKERQHSGGRDHGTECDCADGSLEIPIPAHLVAEEPDKDEGHAGGDDEGAGYSDEPALPVHEMHYTHVGMRGQRHQIRWNLAALSGVGSVTD